MSTESKESGIKKKIRCKTNTCGSFLCVVYSVFVFIVHFLWSSSFLCTGVGEEEEDIEARRMMSGGKLGANSKPRPAFGDQEVDNLVMRAFIEMNVSFNKYLTIFDFTKWATGLVTRHEDLSDAFRVNWKFSTLSDFERKGMSPVHQYRQGIISLPELQYIVAKHSLLYKPCLMLKQRRLIHERSMAMGDDDPTKPDYR